MVAQRSGRIIAIFLASDEEGFITGQVIPVHGGFLACGYAKTARE